MGFSPHYLLDLIIAFCCFVCAGILVWWARALPSHVRRNVWLALGAMCILIAIGAALSASRINRRFPSAPVAYIRCAAMVAAFGLLYSFPILAATRKLGGFNPARRQAMRLGFAATASVPAAVGAFAFVTRNDLVYREVDVRLPAHAAALDGLRIVQLTDMHLGPFVSEGLIRRAVGMANDSKADLAFVTGDFINTKGDPLDACLKIVSGLRATAGIYGCNGNHEIYAEAERYATENAARLGMRILRSEAVPLVFNGVTLNLAGIDYQRKGSKYLEGVDDLILPGAYNLLLSHNPDLFPVAAAKGFDLTVGGHTHGGQVTLEMIHPALNPVRFRTPFVHGLYEKGDRRLYVSRGIGTIGVPARLGAPPEVVCLRLCATSS